MMKQRCLSAILMMVAILVATSSAAQQKSILFDAAHAQTAGNADWTLDEDSCGTAQRFPTPDQAGITSSTAETYWNGAHSAMGVDLVKKGFHVESLPVGARISYGDSTNAQDLSHYNIFVMPEPNIALTSTEITAIRSFVQNGGGLFMISDHAGADRNNDGIDAAGVFNALMGSPSVFGITYNDNSADKTSGWFDDHPDVNYTTDTTSAIVWAGAFGVPSSTKGLGLFGSSSMTLSGAAKGHIWKTSSTHDTSSGVTFATSTYGTGRIAAIADSSVTEDATNSCGHSTFLGYNDPSYDNGLLVANGIAWLAAGSGGGGDTQAPTVSITAPVNGATVSGTVSVTANASDNVGVTKVEFYADGVLQSTDTTSPYSWSWNTTTFSNATHSLTAKAYDAANNVGTSSAVSVTVNNAGGGDTQAPTISITAPANGATVSGTVSVTATASDNVGVPKVEFYLDGALRTTDTTSPYSWSWDTTTFANSSHTLVAKAYDAAGNVGTSANVTVTVNNTVAQQLLGNPGFETGTAAPWTATAGIIDNSTGEAAHSGSWKAWLDGYGTSHTDTLLQQVTIPSTVTSATLTFWLHIDTAETTTTTAFDTLKVQIRNSSGTVLATLATYSNLDHNTGFAQKSFNLISYKGQTIQVYLIGVEDTTLQTSFVVDDFALNVQ
jgi:hypothetical protein